MESFNELLNILEEQLQAITYEYDDILQRSEIAIGLCRTALAKLRSQILKTGFASRQHEIRFFKEIKPQFASRLIYHVSLYNIEANRPMGSRREQRRYFSGELQKLRWFFNANLEFCRYHRTRNTLLDHKYFLRGKQDIRLNVDSFAFTADPLFSTSHDYKVARILASNLLKVYLEEELVRLRRKRHRELVPRKPVTLPWTDSKIALIELIYALHAARVIRNGNIEIAELAKACEAMFNIDLKDYYRKFIEIRSRKQDATKFITRLKDSLQAKLNEEVE